MSLLWRSLSSSALLAGVVLAFSGCKSGGGLWTPGWGKLGSSSSDLAVSRPTTKVPKPSGEAAPSTAGSLASSSSAPGTQNGPYGTSAERTSSPSSTYGSRPAAWQGEPHSSVAPAGGYQTGGPYSMASRSSQPGITPGAYAQPSGAAAFPASRTTGQQDQALGQAQPAADAYSGAGVYSGAALPEASPAGATGAAGASDASDASIYPETNPAGSYAVPEPAAGTSAPPPSSAPGAVIEPTTTTTTSGTASSTTGETANPAATSTSSTASGEVISNPYSLPSSPPVTTRPPTNSTPTNPPSTTTSPASSTTPFTAPALPSSLSGSPGSYRPGSTASPGSRYDAGNTIYEPSTTAGGTGYSTADGTIMR